MSGEIFSDEDLPTEARALLREQPTEGAAGRQRYSVALDELFDMGGRVKELALDLDGAVGERLADKEDHVLNVVMLHHPLVRLLGAALLRSS